MSRASRAINKVASPRRDDLTERLQRRGIELPETRDPEPWVTGARLARAAPNAMREPVEIAPPTLRRTDKPATPIDAFWNGIARAWFVDVDGRTVRLDPQPPAPGGVPVSPRIDL